MTINRFLRVLPSVLVGVTASLCGAVQSAAAQEAAFKGKIAVAAKDSIPDWPMPATAPEGAPNIVLILLDDVGFGDASTFGGPIPTPALTALSRRGVSYNNFHVVGVCSPTRAALLSGRNHHKVGWGDVGQTGFPGYNGIWPKSAASVAEGLRRSGYSTAAIGKWHNTPAWESSVVGPFDHWPTGMGFEYFYGFLDGFTSFWEPALWRNTTPIDPSGRPEDGYHFMPDIVDDSINWIHTHQLLAPQKPYFLYLAPGAAHFPHHVPPEWIEKFKGQFDSGWDAMRTNTFQRQLALGIVPQGTELTPRPPEFPAWDSLPAMEKQLYARQMEVYAGFLAQTDHEIGRLLTAIRNGPDADNTVIIYIAGDNGSSSEGGIEGSDEIADTLALVHPATPVAQQFKERDKLGGPSRMNHYASAWGWAGTTPFQWSKQMASHLGATQSPMVVSWPARIKPDTVVRQQFTHLVDVVPTIYEIARVEPPADVDGAKQMPFDGTSFAYSFDRPEAPARHETQYFEVMGNRAIYQKGWMASARHSYSWIGERSDDFDGDRWELYHLAEDFSQAHDLAAQQPEKLRELQQVFDEEARKNNVYPLQKWLPGPPEFMRSINHYPDPHWIGGPPSLRGPARPKIVYHTGMPRMAPVQNFAKSFNLTADVAIPEGGATGIIVSVGGRWGGLVLYVNEQHRLVYASNFFGRKVGEIVSDIEVKSGRNVLSCAVEKAEEHALNVAGNDLRGVKLFINGQPVGEARLPFGWTWYGRTFGVGRAYETPVSDKYEMPFIFTGKIDAVTVETDESP